MARIKILVAVLNWGLGHATRSVPIIEALLEEDFEPIIASDGEALVLLRKEFPELQWMELPSYKISYPEKGKNIRMHFLLIGPRMLKAIIMEHRTIRKFLSSQEYIGGIISDNRLGAYSKNIPSVYTTHQVRVLSRGTTGLTTRIHKFFIEKFTECWIPDLEGAQNFSGVMGHVIKLSVPHKYLGILSRFKKQEKQKKYDLLVLLSGPEIQRSLLEAKLLMELRGFKGRVLFVRGKMEGDPISEERGGMEIRNHLTGAALETALNEAEVVLSRSGYSSIMDLAVLGKKAFFIPTPGQFEQEYLAEELERKNIAPFSSQEEFEVRNLEKISSYSGFSGFRSESRLASFLTLFKSK